LCAAFGARDAAQPPAAARTPNLLLDLLSF
jgi:hypothetical protein